MAVAIPFSAVYSISGSYNLNIFTLTLEVITLAHTLVAWPFTIGIMSNVFCSNLAVVVNSEKLGTGDP